MKARKHFDTNIEGKNFMTPDVLEVGWLRDGSLSYELASGEGVVEGSLIYGVTTSRTWFNLDRAWASEKEARVYITYLAARLGRKE